MKGPFHLICNPVSTITVWEFASWLMKPLKSKKIISTWNSFPCACLFVLDCRLVAWPPGCSNQQSVLPVCQTRQLGWERRGAALHQAKVSLPTLRSPTFYKYTLCYANFKDLTQFFFFFITHRIKEKGLKCDNTVCSRKVHTEFDRWRRNEIKNRTQFSSADVPVFEAVNQKWFWISWLVPCSLFLQTGFC